VAIKHEDTKHEDHPEPAHAPATVRVKCIVHNYPWTDTKPLDFGEEADVSEAIAKLLEKRKFVERVK